MLLRLFSASLLILSSHALVADEPVPTESLAKELVGTWKMVSARYGDRDSDLPKRMVVVKHITPTHMTWFRAHPTTKVVADMASGKWTLEGDQFADFPEFGVGPDFKTVKGGAHRFTCKIVDNRWYHTGALENGLTIEEVWERQVAEDEAGDGDKAK